MMTREYSDDKDESNDDDGDKKRRSNAPGSTTEKCTQTKQILIPGSLFKTPTAEF